MSPVVRLVDTVIFTSLERRASDIHIETRDNEVAVKYRIDGVLQYAMQPLAKDWHATILSRIKDEEIEYVDVRFTDALGVELGWRWTAIEAVGHATAHTNKAQATTVGALPEATSRAPSEWPAETK